MTKAKHEQPKFTADWVRPEFTNEHKAGMQAVQIKNYWHDKGFHDVTTWTVKESVGHGQSPVWGTRSNIRLSEWQRPGRLDARTCRPPCRKFGDQNGPYSTR